MRLVWTLLAGLTVASPARAERPDRPDLDLRLPAHHVEVLHLPIPSGPEVAVIADATAPVVAVATMVGGGLAAEPLDRPGLAAAAAARWAEAIAEEDLALGARTRVEVLPDATLFVTEAPAHALPALLEREARRAREPFPVAEGSAPVAAGSAPVAAGVSPAVSPMAAGVSPARDPRFGPLFEALWGDHPYGRLGRAPARDLRDDELRAWAAESSRTSIAVLGAVDLDVVGFDVLAAFAPHLVGLAGDRPGQRRSSTLVGIDTASGVRLPRLRGRALPDASLPSPAAPSERASAHVARPTALVGWALPPEGAVAGPLIEQAADRIVRAIVGRFELDPRVDDIACERVPGELGTSLVCALGCRDAEAARAIAGAVPRTRFARGLVADTRDWHRRDLVAVVHELWEPYGARARRLALHLHTGGSPMHMNDRLRGHDYDAIDVRRFLRDHAGPDRAARVVLLPG